MKGSKYWGLRDVRNRAVNGKVEVLGKLMREGLDEKLDLWLEIGHFQIFPIDRFLPTRGALKHYEGHNDLHYERNIHNELWGVPNAH